MHNNKKEENIKKLIGSWHEFEKENQNINNEINNKENQLIQLSKEIAIQKNLLRNEYNELKLKKCRLERRIKVQKDKKDFFTNHVSLNNYSFIISNQMTIIEKSQASTNSIYEIVKDTLFSMTHEVEKEVLNSTLIEIDSYIKKVFLF